MTLVANFSLNNWPVLVGDIMISSPARERKTQPFNIPTYANVNAHVNLSTGCLVSELVQKVIVLSPRLALAWAGSSLCASSVVNDILERSDSSPEFHHVVTVLDERQHEPGMDLYVTGIYLVNSQKEACAIARFAWDSDSGWDRSEQKFQGYGDCYAGGTGANIFLSLLDNTICDLPAQTPPLESTICHSLAHLGKLAGDQIRLGTGIEEYYGGAFEVASLLEGRLQKIGDVAYHFWEAKGAHDGQISITPHVALKMAYFEDYLLIRSFSSGRGKKIYVEAMSYMLYAQYINWLAKRKRRVLSLQFLFLR